MTREERISQWHEIIEQQASSGMSGAAFCREHGINPSRFYHWRLRLKEDAAGGFLELKADVSPSKLRSATAGILIHVSGTISIELAQDFDAASLQRAVHVLQDCSRLPCFP